MERRTFTREFKVEAVKLFQECDSSHSMIQVYWTYYSTTTNARLCEARNVKEI